MIPHFTGLWRAILKSARQKRKLPLSSLSLRSDCFLFRCRRTGTGQSRPSRIGPGLFRRTELRAQGAHLPPCHEFGLFFFGIRPVSLRWFFEDPCHALSPGSARKKSAALRADAVLGRDPILLRFVFAPTPTASWQTADGFPHVFRDCADPRCIAARSGSQRACASFPSPSSHS